MGVMKKIHTALQERESQDTITEEEAREMALDFDNHLLMDADWWREQDAQYQKEEAEHIEREAEIQEYRTMGYM